MCCLSDTALAGVKKRQQTTEINSSRAVGSIRLADSINYIRTKLKVEK
jgi:hypothetical protein